MNVLAIFLGITCVVSGQFCSKRLVRGKWVTIGDCGSGSKIVKDLGKRAKPQLPSPPTPSTVETKATTPANPVVRLVNGFNKYSGRVEVYYNGTWGTVCDDRWGIADARVVCRMLGFSDATYAPQSATFGQGTGTIWLDEVQCIGNETSLFNCSKRSWGEHDCRHTEDASVACTPMVRLVDGHNSYSGRVELFHEGKWGRVWDDDWDINNANVVCSMLGLPSAVSASQGSGIVWLDNVRCTGKETSILDCSNLSWTCGYDKAASVVCRALPVRLVDGFNSYSGRVEVLYYGVWGTVCDNNWDIKDANVICHMFGFPGAMSAPHGAFFGKGTGGIWLNDVRCTGNETSLFGCLQNSSGKHDCNHGKDASVVCSPPSVRLVNGTNSYSGRVEINYNGTWGTVCDNNWDINDANVICRMFGFANAMSAPRGANFGQGTGRIYLSDVSCTGTEASIFKCSMNSPSHEICDHDKDASVVCQPIALRLVHGSNPYSGRVEVNYLGKWGTVCDDYWGMDDAKVVCRMLGFPDALSAPRVAIFGEGTGRIWLDNVKCTGTETTLFGCLKNSWGEHDCHHYEDASVVCLPPSVRLVNGRNSYSGRVEVKYNGTWGTVCDHDWDINDANVICSMFGFANATSAPRGANFGQGTGRIWFDNVSCTGTEASIFNCTKNSSSKEICDHDKDASVVCQPLAVRLVNGSNSHSGRVEINYIGEWGTICDDHWDIDDANVVCRMLGFSNAKSAPGAARFGQGVGRIWLDNVKCAGTEESIWDCTKGTWGYHNCVHAKDASAVCKP